MKNIGIAILYFVIYIHLVSNLFVIQDAYNMQQSVETYFDQCRFTPTTRKNSDLSFKDIKTINDIYDWLE